MAKKEKMDALEKARAALERAQAEVAKQEALASHGERLNPVRELVEEIGAETCVGVANATLKDLGLKMRYIGVARDDIESHIKEHYLKSKNDSVVFDDGVKSEIASQFEATSPADVTRTLVEKFSANGETRGKTSKYKLPA